MLFVAIQFEVKNERKHKRERERIFLLQIREQQEAGIADLKQSETSHYHRRFQSCLERYRFCSRPFAFISSYAPAKSSSSPQPTYQ